MSSVSSGHQESEPEQEKRSPRRVSAEFSRHLQDDEIDEMFCIEPESESEGKQPNDLVKTNCLVIQGPILCSRKIPPVSKAEQRNTVNFEVFTEDHRGSINLKKWKAFKHGLIWFVLLTITFLGLGSVSMLEKLLGLCGLSSLGYILYESTREKTVSSPTRVITWRLEDCSDELKTGFLSSPEFCAGACRWRLVIRQKRFTRGLQTSFGIIATNIPNNLANVEVNLHFSLANSAGQDLVMDMKKLTFNGVFESGGDCGYSANILLTQDQIMDDQLHIKCRATFSSKSVGILKSFSCNEQRELLNNGPRKVSEVGQIYPEVCDCEPIQISSGSSGVLNFVQNSETKSFVWKIADFENEILGTECWGIYSPQVVVNSHGICSLWRFKLVELHGTYRIHFQVRGLPRGVAQIMACYAIELLDNFGDFVFPEGSFTRVVYPDYLSIYGTIRMPLYCRQTIMTRFFSRNTGLTLRISLNVEPVENSSIRTLHGTNSCEWIVSRQH